MWIIIRVAKKKIKTNCYIVGKKGAKIMLEIEKDKRSLYFINILILIIFN